MDESCLAKKKKKSEGDEWRRGPWTAEEDKLLIHYVSLHGDGRWNTVARSVGLKRSGKSCRMRWVNYLRPDLKKGHITTEEARLILALHGQWGNRWSIIARYLPGRTDNEIKNFWRTHFNRRRKLPSAKRGLRGAESQNQLKYKEKKRFVNRSQEKKIQGCSNVKANSYGTNLMRANKRSHCCQLNMSSRCPRIPLSKNSICTPCLLKNRSLKSSSSEKICGAVYGT